MKFNRNPLSQAINLTLCAGATTFLLLSSGTAFAQDEQSEEGVELDRVVVTGSRIKRTDLEGVSPVVTISRDELVASGHTSIQDYIRTLTITQANNGDDFNNSFANGTSTINLRGLGGNATLTLLNGRRIAAYGQGQNITEAFVDLNAIPLSAVERIEILKDGASAIYGADAVAGVVNIILRQDYEGAEYNLGYMTDSEGDAPQFNGGMIFGGASDNTHFTTIVNYLHREGLDYADRDFSASADMRYRGGSDFRSSAGFPGTVWDPVQAAIYPAPGCGTIPGTNYDSGPQGPNDILCRMNFNSFINAYPESERYSIMNFIDHELSDNTNLYFDLFVNYNTTINRAAAAPFFGPYFGTAELLPDDWAPGTTNYGTYLSGGTQLYFPATNPHNPFGYDVGLRHRAISLGQRIGEINAQTYWTNLGVEGFFGSSLWEYDTGFTYSRSDVLVENHGYQNAAHLQQTFMGVLDPAGSGEMIYYNPFAAVQDQRVVDYVNLVYDQRNVSDELMGYFTATGPLFEFGSGEVSMAVGAEYREQDLSAEADQLRNLGGLVGTGRGNNTFGSREQTSVYAELYIPLGPLEIQLAGRYEDYSDFGTTTKPKVGFKWNATDSLLLRASWGESFRAPSLFELFGGVVSSFPSGLVDPARCIDPTAGPGQNGNPPDLDSRDCGNGQHQVDNGGNPGLQPEEAESWSAGIAWEPTDGLYFQLDYFQYEHENIITQLGNQTILNLNDPAFVERSYAPNGPVVKINNSYINGAFQELSGVDFYFQWNIEGLGGLWNIGNEMTWYDTYEFRTFSGVTFEGVGGRVLGDFPEIKDNLSVGYSIGDHNIQGLIHYRSGIENHFASMDSGSTSSRCGSRTVCDTGSHTTFDLSYTYYLDWGGNVQLGCINCTDEDPPPSVYGDDTGGYFTSLDDPRGLVLFARWTQGF